MKHCIFHIPYKLDLNSMAAPMLRPNKLIEAFEKIGYTVDVVEGIAEERKIKIKEIKQKIKNGVKYDFMYAESSTMPTLLTESHHFPTHPFLDFSFFKYIKKNNINIGLFYRDLYWKFDIYKKSLPAWKSFFAIKCYQYDLWQYARLLDKFYLPSLKVYKYLQSEKFDGIVEVLPPGCETVESPESIEQKNFSTIPLNIFYVGGLGNQYQIRELMKAVKTEPKCELTVCCRENEWDREKGKLSDCLSSNIHIIHKSNSELEQYYEKADICSLLFKPDIYIEMAMPYKAFEYLAHSKPVLASKGTAIGDFVEKNNIGWVMDYTAEAIKKTITDIIATPSMLKEKYESCVVAKEQNLWTERAEKVVQDLRN